MGVSYWTVGGLKMEDVTMFKEGYLIVQKSEVAFEAYKHKAEKFVPSNYLERLRNAMSAYSPTKYKGISRYPITLGDIGIPFIDDEVFEDTIFMRRETAERIFQQLENHDDYEIIKVFLPNIIDHSGDLLGYDVGYFGGDCFSVICDSFVMPRWHPPVLEEIEVLAKQMKRLNQNLLFPDEGSAQEFYEYYIKQEWAEKPVYPGQIHIIGVSYV
jgi:hypothetical protein